MTEAPEHPSPTARVERSAHGGVDSRPRARGGWEGLDELPRVVLHSIVGAYVLAGVALSLTLARRPLAGLELYAFQLLVGTTLYPIGYAVVLRLMPAMRRLPPGDAWRLVLDTVRRELLAGNRLPGFLLLGSVVAVVLASFTSWKLSIPRVAGFGWDATFARCDQLLHLGRHPWEWLQPIVGRPVVTRALDFIYFPLWFPVVFGIFTWQTWRAPGAARTRFAATFLATIILVGTLAATVLASAGPQFFARIVEGPDPYAPLLAYLDEVSRTGPLVAVQIREWLWAVHEQDSVVGGAGIAAMPSVHVALAELCAIVGRRRGGVTGALTTTFSLLTLVGSVHLAPHYAIDGYASIAIVHGLWWLTGRLTGERADRSTPDDARIRIVR